MVPFVSAFAAAALCVVVFRERRRLIAAERLGAATLETLLNAVDANDPVTGNHVRRVAASALVLADAAGLDRRRCRSVERVALFHDIGKIHEALFDILHDTDKLTPEERREVMTHPERGSDVLEPLEAFYPELRDGVLAHHERWDGTGYPRGLKGERIPLEARIVAIADTFDAVLHTRRYNDARGDQAAADVIREGRGTQFDPELADLFLLPPVLGEIGRTTRRVGLRPRRGEHGARRRQKKASAAPDVTFRWRTSALPLPAPDLSRAP
jgi:HD-GYP domain-containing protein (c-di-GMP phosphodiesterase class II)